MRIQCMPLYAIFMCAEFLFVFTSSCSLCASSPNVRNTHLLNKFFRNFRVGKTFKRFQKVLKITNVYFLLFIFIFLEKFTELSSHSMDIFLNFSMKEGVFLNKFVCICELFANFFPLKL